MKLLTDAMHHLQIQYTDEMLEQFQKYMDFILEWNEKVNLTAITDKEEFVKKHFVDSILCGGIPQVSKANKIIDVGTGAGFPGVPLAIIYPEKEFLLMDSLNKRIKIIKEITDEIQLKNISVRHGRAEDLGREKDLRECFDLCVSRAVANLAVLSEYCLPFVKVGGWFAAYKSAGAEEEIKNSLKAITMLGGKLQQTQTQNIPGFDLEHPILLIEKVNKTLAKYPRKAGTPAKEPLK
ncbi:16S rRNA (guanine(527)-N(7))-methyltransferase RsmG [Sinanaerobacter chloroacetimidivorans]|uniref:Ribosomal RNA small subunit methyltransferase G n=1 Tax=Sinanaerobacter chloroacetimidivorans TaxID=2818044 RepID=A0A8J7W118_9FIRM|nr:16S rRNA (guanine(527)-N(7))-methyltransferase RsmG [Sinanaerobacter chloroacetimidivorans]MBR0598429.1 16S rRNA (guanine(527)-N(7))-methyltransferase RsmG [Sinanaerobacter chloroacetimidivorans]